MTIDLPRPGLLIWEFVVAKLGTEVIERSRPLVYRRLLLWMAPVGIDKAELLA